jgi:hypothetical protein
MRRSIAIALLVMSVAAAAEGQEATDRYLLLATERTSTMQGEINEAAARGFRVLTASPSDGSEVIVLLEQTEEKHQYLLLAAARTSTLQRELTDAAEAGYRILPRALVRKGDETLVLLEKGPDDAAKARYLVLETEHTGTLQKEINQASLDGYTLVAVSSHGDHVAILERGAR